MFFFAFYPKSFKSIKDVCVILSKLTRYNERLALSNIYLTALEGRHTDRGSHLYPMGTARSFGT